MSRLGGAGAVAQLIADIPLSVKVTPSVKKDRMLYSYAESIKLI
jgi:hypothetical protein